MYGIKGYTVSEDWKQKLFNYMAHEHDKILVDTELRDIFYSIIEFDPEFETKLLNDEKEMS